MYTFLPYIRVVVFLGFCQVTQVHAMDWGALVDRVKGSPESTAKVVGKPMTLLSLSACTLYAGKSIYEALESYLMYELEKSKLEGLGLASANEASVICSSHLDKAKQKSVEAFVSVLGAVGSYALFKQLG